MLIVLTKTKNIMMKKNEFQVQFDGVRLVQAIATQGRADLLYLQFVTKYRVMHSTDCVHFVTYRTSNGADMVRNIYCFLTDFQMNAFAISLSIKFLDKYIDLHSLYLRYFLCSRYYNNVICYSGIIYYVLLFLLFYKMYGSFTWVHVIV